MSSKDNSKGSDSFGKSYQETQSIGEQNSNTKESLNKAGNKSDTSSSGQQQGKEVTKSERSHCGTSNKTDGKSDKDGNFNNKL